MPNIPPLAHSVVASRYFVSVTLFLAWCLWIWLAPHDIVQFINSALAGWFIGTQIFELSLKWEDRNREQ